MGKVEKYQNIIVELLKKHAAYKPVNIEDAERQVIADTVRNHFQLVTIGWEKQRFVHNCSFHFDIKGEKIWIQQNWTDIDIAKELEEMGVPKSDIVLGFQPPKYRSFTGYAEA
ncbi:MAG: XisI protein [Bacteroidetes bacterium]|nr:XisI protein [Bacteroidota bacterium]